MALVANRIIAAAQVVLSVVFLVGYFTTLGLFLLGRVSPPVEWEDTIKALISVITAGVLMILSFWFQRSRQNEKSEP
jgi:hypothetical protein